MRNAVYGNLKLMRKTLSAEQYAKYAALMNLTLLNKGIARNKWLLSHPDANIAGSVAGIKGENLSVK